MSSWTDYIRNNFWLKLFSLGLAMLIWFTVHPSGTFNLGFSMFPFQANEKVEIFTRPVSILIPPGQGQRFTITPPEAVITLQGTTEAIQNLSESQVKPYVRIDDANSPLGSFLVEVIMPANVDAIKITPTTVAVESTSEPFKVFHSPPSD